MRTFPDVTRELRILAALLDSMIEIGKRFSLFRRGITSRASQKHSCMFHGVLQQQEQDLVGVAIITFFPFKATKRAGPYSDHLILVKQ